MKKLILGFLLLSTTPALAAYNGPLIVKHSHSGFTPEEYSRATTCEIWLNKVVVKKFYARGYTLTETRAIETENLFDLIEKAAAETAKTDDVMLCDAPGHQLKAIRILPNDGVEDVIIDQSPSCGGVSVTREGPYSGIIREMMDNYCQK